MAVNWGETTVLPLQRSKGPETGKRLRHGSVVARKSAYASSGVGVYSACCCCCRFC